MWLQLFVSIRFQVCFTPLIGVLFTFPSRYLFAIGCQDVCSLGRWSSLIHAIARATWDDMSESEREVAYRIVTLSHLPFQTVRLSVSFLTLRAFGKKLHISPTTPYTQRLPSFTRKRLIVISLVLASCVWFGLFPLYGNLC